VNDAGEFDYSQFLAYIFEQPHDTNEEFRVFSQEFKHDQLAQSFDRLVLFAQSLYADFDNAKQRDEIRFIVERAAQQYIKRRIEEISSALDTETDPQKIQTLSEEFNRLVNYYK
jgi:predicted metal-dependent hydrolase